MAKLSGALDEVDRKVDQLRHRFESLTKEAAELKIKLDKENEIIEAAETLVLKLDGEYHRWSNQVNSRRYYGFVIVFPFQRFIVYTLQSTVLK